MTWGRFVLDSGNKAKLIAGVFRYYAQSPEEGCGDRRRKRHPVVVDQQCLLRVALDVVEAWGFEYETLLMNCFAGSGGRLEMYGNATNNHSRNLTDQEPPS